MNRREGVRKHRCCASLKARVRGNGPGAIPDPRPGLERCRIQKGGLDAGL